MNKEMIDSGIEWIGKIPATWKIERLQGYLYEINDKNNPIRTTNILSLTNKLGVVPYSKKGNKGNVAKDNYDEYKIAYPDTIVANSMNILIGSVGYCNYYGCVSPVYYVFKNKDNTNLNFLNYLFQTQPFQKELRKYANGILEIRLRVSSDDILKREIAIPSSEEQQKIVEKLDKKISQIDKLITNQEKQIAKLKDYKQSLITKVVTKGLNPNVEMKDSGVEWIEKIPSEWSVYPIKYLFCLSKGLPITKENLIEDGIKVISYGQLHAKNNISVTADDSLYRFVSESYLETHTECLVDVDDMIMADTSEDLEGTCDFVRINTKDKIFAGYHSIILKKRLDISTEYLAYLFMTDTWRKQFRSKVNGVKLFSLTQKILNQGTAILPNEEEQKKIVNYINGKCLNIYRLIQIKQYKIEKLQNYKKSIIYEYVTGKKDVC